MAARHRSGQVMGAMGAVLLAAAATGAQPSGAEALSVRGAWFMEVTPRNCATGAQVAPKVNSLVTFHADGTMRESPATLGFAPGQRTDGHGAWEHRAGDTYAQHFVALIAFTTSPGPGGPGFEAGWLSVTHTARLIDRDTLQSSGTNAFYRTDGTLYRSGCSTATGRRIE